MPVLLLVISLVLIGSIATADGSKNQKNWNVGVIIPLSGPYANFGIAGRSGIEMAIEESSTRGVDFFYEDSQNEAAKAVTAFNRLLADRHIDLLIVLSTACATAILPLAEARGVPVFMWTASSRLSTGHAGAVRLMASGSEQGRAIAERALRLDFTHVAFFSAQGEFFQTIRDGFLEQFTGDRVISAIEVPADSMDFRSEITKARMKGVKQMGICLSTGQTSSFIRQAHELYPEAPLFGCHSVSSPEILRQLQDSHSNLWFAEGRLNERFIKRFAERQPESSGIWVGGAFYDVARIIQDRSFTYRGKPLSMSLFHDQCLSESALDGSCIVTEQKDTFLKTKLGITAIKNGEFDRSHDF